MDLQLSENIRSFRKQRRLTQEQLAEVLDVTAGAVYKWESGMSVPDLSLIVEMADFFDTSVDVLLGYQMKDNRLKVTVERLDAYLRNGDPEAMNEAEKALKKYPNSFEIVHACAEAYLIFGTEKQDRQYLMRAIRLFENALMLIAQNTDPKISEYTICGAMGAAYVSIGEYEKGLEILKRHNTGGMFSDSIGTSLAVYMRRYEEAEPYLSDSLLQSTARMINNIIGFAFIYDARREYQLLKEIVLWGLGIINGLKSEKTQGFADKICSIILILLAHAQIRTDEADAAKLTMRKAAEHVKRFDAMPDFSIGSVRFAAASERDSMYDGFGLTARDSAKTLIGLLKDPVLEDIWKGVSDE